MAFEALNQRGGGPPPRGEGYTGEYEETSGIASYLEGHNLVHSESMELKNDPRFFQDNVLNYRLSAFASLAVVSGLMVGNTMGDMWDMNKSMHLLASKGSLLDFDGIVQLIAFSELIMIFFANILATYVGVAQPYHTARLMTAGPTGFETAASYYLNRNIVAWRHGAIKYMLLSIPLYVSQMGIRLIVKFDRSTEVSPDKPIETPIGSMIEGIVFAVVMILLACMLYSVHTKHFDVFRDRYDAMHRQVTGNDFNAYMQKMMTSGRANGMLDV